MPVWDPGKLRKLPGVAKSAIAQGKYPVGDPLFVC